MIWLVILLVLILCGGYLIASRIAYSILLKKITNRAAEIWNKADLNNRTSLLEKAGFSSDDPSFRRLLGSTWEQLDENVSSLLAITLDEQKQTQGAATHS